MESVKSGGVGMIPKVWYTRLWEGRVAALEAVNHFPVARFSPDAANGEINLSTICRLDC